MKRLMLGTLLAMATAGTAFAQEPRGFVEGSGGVASTSDGTSGNVGIDVGRQVAPHLIVFGSIGRLRNVEPSLVQPGMDAAVAALGATDVNVIGTARAPATYGLGGVRFSIPTHAFVTPYLLAGVGIARVTPNARFVYSSGTSLGTTTDMAGQDVTSDVTTAGYFTQPAAQNVAVIRFGGGIQVPLGRSIVGEVGYSVFRLSTATPVTAQSVTFGLGLRF
jgi:hypothetical protein